MSSRILDWFDQRLHLESVRKALDKKTVPIHRHTVWYFVGGMALFLFTIQFVTGILLLFYYKPTAEEAFESVQYIMTEVSFGWLVRSIHAWAADLLVAVVAVHLISVYFLQAYRRPREMLWISGCVLLLITLGFGFTGYLLPWNQLAFFATAVGTEMAGSVPLIGQWTLEFLRGGPDVSGATLSRFFAIHVWVLPGSFLLFVAVHLFLVQAHGMSEPVGAKSKGKIKFYPDFLLRDVVGWLLAVGILAALGALFPWELGEKADPFSPAPEGIKPEWYFLFMFQALKLIPGTIGPFPGDTVGVVLFGIGALALFLVPFIDRKADRGEKDLLLRWVGIVAVAFVAIMTIWGILE